MHRGPAGQAVVGMLPLEVPPGVNPPWLDAPNFTGIVEDHGKLEIRFLRMVKRNGSFGESRGQRTSWRGLSGPIGSCIGSGSC